MERLTSAEGLVVSQKKEWGEILTGFETRNRYRIMDTQGQDLLLAAEEGGNLLLRWFLKALRPFTVQVRGMDNNSMLRVRRPFRFFFHEAQISDAAGKPLGTIRRQFALLRRIYTVTDAQGRDLCQLFGPILRPWTFQVLQGGIEQGKICKKWSGLLKEGFTDADNFGVTFPPGWSNEHKALLLGAVFLIDFVHFEKR
ncbi:scramblase, putative [Syntrophotalea carbinolica DSM 2380]|uniref:Scramblase, putative n=1 Tax=Syntrophotalea carbinolica (strain DSM 2380 / NBRC 103641 / GraBd1) TaxID=338963 RepID=Q3A051_SYNC1|nr:phospholipid scramblase-related protein [Syntrophotalea carbinolica]ABA90256.1 scramblase, putative [Syntrophotalea carbinolica DSM 2380]